jgi:TrmH family RNA methyltransferase
MERVRSRRNRRVATALRLRRTRDRRSSGSLLLEGPHLLDAALGAGITVGQVFALEVEDVPRAAVDAGADVVLVTPDVMQALSDTQHPRGPVAVVDAPERTMVSEETILVPWDVQDPGNIGALIRTAAAFGMGVLLVGESADPWSPKVLRSAAGGHFLTTIEHRSEIAISDLRGRGYHSVAAVTHGGVEPRALPIGERLAILVGNEAAGLPEEIREAADDRVTIPIRSGIGSLNAAIAGAILAYEVTAVARLRKRRGAPEARD